MHYTNEHESRLAVESLKVFRDFAQVVGGDCGFERVGFLQIVARGHERALAANVAWQQRLGINTREVTPEEIRDILPGAYADDIGAAAYEPDSGFAGPSATAFAFAEAARRNGARIETGCRGHRHRHRGGPRGRGRDLPGPDRHPGGRARAWSLGRATSRTPWSRFRPDAVPHPALDLSVAGGLHAAALRGDRRRAQVVAAAGGPRLHPDRGGAWSRDRRRPRPLRRGRDPDFVERCRKALAARLPVFAEAPCAGAGRG